MGGLLICGKCAYDREKDEVRPKTRELHKVIFCDYADILCSVCRRELEEEKEDLASRYLGGKG